MQSPMGCAPSSSSGCSPLYPDPTHPLWEVKSGSTPIGPPPGGGHISWVLTRPSWSAHLWMPTRMLTFVSRSHSPSWEDGSGCTPGRHPLRLHLAHLVITAAIIASTSRSPGRYGRHLLHLYLAHLATTAPHCDLAHHCLVAVALGRTGLLSHHSTHLLPDSHTVITSVNRLTLTTHFRH